MENIEIFDPTVEAKEQPIYYVPRPKSLRDLHIGLVENMKHHSEDLLVMIARILQEEHSAKSHVVRSKHNPSAPILKETIDELVSSCDVIIAGIGD